MGQGGPLGVSPRCHPGCGGGRYLPEAEQAPGEGPGLQVQPRLLGQLPQPRGHQLGVRGVRGHRVPAPTREPPALPTVVPTVSPHLLSRLQVPTCMGGQGSGDPKTPVPTRARGQGTPEPLSPPPRTHLVAPKHWGRGAGSWLGGSAGRGRRWPPAARPPPRPPPGDLSGHPAWPPPAWRGRMGVSAGTGDVRGAVAPGGGRGGHGGWRPRGP